MARANGASRELTELEVELLDLDPENPRLPEEYHNQPASTLLKYFYDNMVLEELAQSFIDNGFFVHEPLIVVPKARRRYTVVEGNRRLAALMILFRRPEAEDLTFDIDASPEDLARLRRVPCYVVQRREEVYRFLGFRHIGGIKKWGAEAKARYLIREVEDAVHSESSSPFRDVGKRVGSNAQGVRSSVTAFLILRHARDEYSINVRSLQNERFSVWQRALNAPNIRAEIGFGEPREYSEIVAALPGLNEKGLRRVLAELTPDPTTRKAVVEDSRDLTDYGRILANKRAATVLARTRDFELARSIVDEADLPKRVLRIKQECDILLQDVQSSEGSDELRNAARQLWQAVRTLWAAVKELSAEDEDDEE